MIDEEQLKEALSEFLPILQFNIGVTLTFNSDKIPTEDLCRSYLRKWDARINNAVFGRKWIKEQGRNIKWVAFMEKAQVNPHYHLAAYVEDEQTMKFLKAAPKYWRKLVQSGTCDVVFSVDRDWCDYIIKEKPIESMILSTEFKS